MARFAALAAVVALSVTATAGAAGQVVSGTVEPTLGVSTDGSGSGTSLATVIRERHGDMLVITVLPR
jgi:hypothetical protein